MQENITIKFNLNGTLIELTTSPNTTFGELREKFGEALGIPVSGVVPTVAGREVPETTPLKDGDVVGCRTVASTKNS